MTNMPVMPTMLTATTPRQAETRAAPPNQEAARATGADLARAQEAQADAARLQQQAQAARADADAARATAQEARNLSDEISRQISQELSEQGIAQQVQRAVERGGHQTIRLPGGQQLVIEDGNIDLSNLFSHTSDSDDLPRQAMQTGVEMVSIVAAAIVAIVVGLPLARAIARWLDRRGTPSSIPPDVVSRLSNIENAVETVAIEVERISEGQRFTSKLLADRAQPVVVGERL